MAETPLDEHLATQDDAVAPVVVALHEAVVAAHPDFEIAIEYRMLTYSIGGDGKTWTCAIGTTTKVVALSFLDGVILDDPSGVLRGGASVLMNWDSRSTTRARSMPRPSAVASAKAASGTRRARPTRTPSSPRLAPSTAAADRRRVVPRCAGRYAVTLGSAGRPRARSPMMLRWIWLEPP